MVEVIIVFVDRWATLQERLQTYRLEDIDLGEYLKKVGDEAQFNFESTNFLMDFYEDCVSVVERVPTTLAKPFQEIFLTAGSPATQIAELSFRDQLPPDFSLTNTNQVELSQEKQLNLEEWNAINAALSPQTVGRLHKLAKEIDLDIYEPYFSPRIDISHPENWSEFDIFKLNCGKWMECLRQAAEKEYGVLILFIC